MFIAHLEHTLADVDTLLREGFSKVAHDIEAADIRILMLSGLTDSEPTLYEVPLVDFYAAVSKLEHDQGAARAMLESNRAEARPTPAGTIFQSPIWVASIRTEALVHQIAAAMQGGITLEALVQDVPEEQASEDALPGWLTPVEIKAALGAPSSSEGAAGEAGA